MFLDENENAYKKKLSLHIKTSRKEQITIFLHSNQDYCTVMSYERRFMLAMKRKTNTSMTLGR